MDSPYRRYSEAGGPRDRLVAMSYGIDFERSRAYRHGFDRVATRERLGVPNAATVVLNLDCPARYAAGMREFVGRTGLESRVTIAPVTPDPYPWLGVADVFVLASDIESLQLIVLEGMAFELPMVATAVFGVLELVQERVLARTAEERSGVARAGARAVPRHHDIQRYAARYRALVRALAEDRQAPPTAFLTGDQRERPMVAAGA